MRLDVFLPVVKHPGRGRRWLGRIGPTWRAAPVRRSVQALFLVLFAVLLFYVCWPYTAAPTAETAEWPSHYADGLADKESVEAEAFLALDPLVSFTTAIAARSWVWSLTWAGVILLVGVLIPRGFCGYVCPLGTLIDIFDATIGKRVRRFRVAKDGWWVHLKYHVLAVTLAAAMAGLLVSAVVAAIPVVTRGVLFILGPIQTGALRGWHQVPPITAGQVVSVALFLGVFLVGLLRPRFWCRHVCPTGAVFSLCNLLRATERKVAADCVDCHKCVGICPFDAIHGEDYSTRTLDCTLCQTCGGVCPTGAIRFAERWSREDVRTHSRSDESRTAPSRRGFLGSTAFGVATALGIRRFLGADLKDASAAELPVRPPMSVPEDDFLRLCIRCGECFRACPNDVLQPLDFQQGLEGLWTPRVAADWSGCDPSCNNCGQVCPTGAIRALPLGEKRVARMGLAVVDQSACLPWIRSRKCQQCVDECTAAGYDAIEFERVGVQVDGDGMPLEGTGYLSPVVLADRCVGCGLCQSVCHRLVVRHEGLLTRAAIVVLAGPGREDRIRSGSYVELRDQRQRHADEARRAEERKLLEGLDSWDFDDS